jgi:hypothetical protein
MCTEGFLRYQNSASLLVNDDTACVRDIPLNLTEDTPLSLDSMPTTRMRLLPVPALKLEIVTVVNGNARVADVDWTLFIVIPPVALTVWGCTKFNGIDCETGTRVNVRITQIQKNDLLDFSDMNN